MVKTCLAPGPDVTQPRPKWGPPWGQMRFEPRPKSGLVLDQIQFCTCVQMGSGPGPKSYSATGPNVIWSQGQMWSNPGSNAAWPGVQMRSDPGPNCDPAPACSIHHNLPPIHPCGIGCFKLHSSEVLVTDVYDLCWLYQVGSTRS